MNALSARLPSPLPLLLVTLLCVTPAWAVDAGDGRAVIPAATGHVTDTADLMPDDDQARLEAFLVQVKERTGAEIAVLTVPDCAPEDPDTYKTRVFTAWRIGDRERDDGLLLLVAVAERALEFETGYGLEGTLPDGWQARMLRETAVPRFRADDPSGGITAAILASAGRIAREKGVTLEWDGRELRYDERARRRPRIPLGLLVFILFFIVLPALSQRGRHRHQGHWGGWGGGFGGGFGGGGFGGGSSFGGFGGGMSGGGGGGARW